MSLTEREAERICEQYRTSTPRQYDFVPAGRAPLTLAEQPLDRRMVAIGEFIEKEPGDALDYIVESLWASGKYTQLLAIAKSVKDADDDAELGRLFRRAIDTADFCKAAERHGSER